MFDGAIELRVHDRDDVKEIMAHLRKIEDLKDVTQIM